MTRTFPHRFHDIEEEGREWIAGIRSIGNDLLAYADQQEAALNHLTRVKPPSPPFTEVEDGIKQIAAKLAPRSVETESEAA
jgi:hypothetical protein